MITLITGGSGSGKSAYAEECIGMLSEGCHKYYLATMQVFGEEGQAKVERHQKLRSGKGFVTIEQTLSIHEVLKKIEKLQADKPEEETEGKQVDSTALLECMSNLVANEMFSEEIPKSVQAVTKKIIREIELLSRGLKHLVIVTNNVFEDGISYDATTMEYIRAMGSINEKLALMADEVVEVVAGIPLTIKEGK